VSAAEDPARDMSQPPAQAAGADAGSCGRIAPAR
jgi:hypothetical protein